LNLLLTSFRRIVSFHTIVLAVSPLLFSQNVLAQSTSSAESSETVSSSPSAPGREKPANHVETSVSVGSMAQLAASRINETRTSLMTQSLAPSAGVFATFRQSFTPWLGYSVNLGYTRSTYRYSSSAPAGTAGMTSITPVPSHMYEISVSYIAQKHFTNRFSVFGEAGGGTVAFAAMNQGLGLPRRSNAFRPEGIAGFGIDYQLAHGLGLRAQYRGLFIRYPYPNDDLDTRTRLTTIISEPTLSLTYTLGKHGHR
jgi:opacity protein-like surface antigen